MVPEYTVRPATSADVDAVLRIDACSDLASHWQKERYLQCVVGQAHQGVSRILLVATASQQVVGFAVAVALTVVVPAEAELENLAVDPAMRRQGVGKALVQAVTTWAADMGAGPVRLEVRAANLYAMELYRQCGFQQTGLRRAYYSTPKDDAVCMELPSADSSLRQITS